MKYYFLTLTFIFFSIYQASAGELPSVILPDFKQERLSATHLRLNNPEQTLHIQIESFDPRQSWQESTLDKDMKVMQEKRKKIYEIMGFSDVTFSDYSFKNQTLTLTGHYKKLSGKKVYFTEKNFYRSNRFLQLKMLADSSQKAEIKDDLVMKLKPFAILSQEESVDDEDD